MPWRNVLYTKRASLAAIALTATAGPRLAWSRRCCAPKEAGPIEFAGFLTEHKAPIPQAHGSEIPRTLAGGRAAGPGP
jgi:hypothetical protein